MIHNDEQETIIQFDPMDDVVHFFSSMPYMVRKYRKLAEKNGITPIRDTGDMIELDIPKSRFTFGFRRIVNYTEERRAAQRERLIAVKIAMEEAKQSDQTS